MVYVVMYYKSSKFTNIMMGSYVGYSRKEISEDDDVTRRSSGRRDSVSIPG